MRLTEKVQALIHQYLQKGDLAIDATAGNGHDTLSLAQCVGTSGRVYAIDIQTAALDATRQRLQANHCLHQCNLIEGDHRQALQSLLEVHSEQARMITFNLGYLPGSDKAIQTTTASTLPALDAATTLLQTDGWLLVTAYRGHPGGLIEAEAVADWFSRLPTDKWDLQVFEPIVKSGRIPPILHVATKLK